METVNTGQQGLPETNSQSESSEESASEDDKLETLKQQLAMKDYQEKVHKEQLAIKERELAEVEPRNKRKAHKLDKEKNENLKLSGELKKQSTATTSANAASYARPSFQTLTRDTGIIAKFQFLKVGISN